MLAEKARLPRIIAVFLLITILTAIPSYLLYAGSTGKITGNVSDKKTGEGVAAANVVLYKDGSQTNHGAMTDLDGYYQILNVAPGIYDIEVTYVGYHPYKVSGVRVDIDLNTNLDAKMTSTAIKLEEVIIVYDRPEVQLDKTSSGTSFDKQKLQINRPETIESLAAMGTGIKIDPEGKMHMRGGRSGSSAFIVEGVDRRDPIEDTQLNFQVSGEAIDAVEVLTGGFNAEYGRVTSGLIQITTAEGSEKSYTGRVEYQTDRIIENYSFDTDRMELSFGGPVPYSKDLMGKPMTFFFSGIGKLNNTWTPFDINREATDHLGIGIKIPERQRNDYQASLKLAYKLTDAQKLTLYTTTSYSQWDIYPYGEGGVSGNYGYNYKYNLENRPWAFNRNFSNTLTFTDQISSKTFYTVKLINFYTRSKVQPRTKSPGEFTLLDDIEDDQANAFDRNGNRWLETDEYSDSDGDGFMDGYMDANFNGIFDGGGEGYEDLNYNGRWDRGEDWVDLNGNGIYDASEPWIDVANPLTGENNIGVYDPWDSYSDVNGNGRWDGAEPQLAEHDWNGNGRWDGERFIDANNNGAYDPWEPWVDANHNFRYDEGEQYFDTNGNGKFDYSEGYDDTNGNGLVDKRDLQERIASPDEGEPFIDGDFYWDTGEPFIDEPDPITGEYNGRWNTGEIWFDLPSSANLATGAGRYRLGTERTLNGVYDPPNGLFDEYELFTRYTDWNSNADRSRPIYYSFGEQARGNDWPADIYQWHEGRSTWINRTIHDVDNPEFNIHNFTANETQEWFLDYNGNGVRDPADQFINPGLWDGTAYWYDRRSIEYTLKFDIQSQMSRFHEVKTGFEMKYRDLEMQSLEQPDLLYTGEASLPAGSPWSDRGGKRDFYHYKPWEGALYVQDKMEFEGLILNAGLRYDFIIHPDNVVEEFRDRVQNDEPGATFAERGTWRFSPRLGISHPITERSKLYFNYGHFYQAPSFQYFYKSATANLDVNTAIGNPNLEYEKTIQYELGVNTQISDYIVFDISGYYKDQYDLISTSEERWKNVEIDRYVNQDYGRMRGFEISIEKRPANHWAMTFNYDFSYAFGKASDQHANQEARLNNVPANYDEHPLAWDETHKVNAYLTVQYNKGDHPHLFNLVMPDDWLMTLQWEFGSGLPYTPSIYTTGIDNSNLILANSARYPWHETTTLKFEKFYIINLKEGRKGNRLFFGFTVGNLFNKQNVQGIYAETGSPTERYHPLNPTYDPNENREEYDANPRNFEPGRNVLFRVGMTF